MNVEKHDDLSTLWDGVDWSRRQLTKTRETRLNLIKQYVGYYYGDNGSPVPLPLNMIQLGVNVYMQHLSSGLPKVLVLSKSPILRPYAANLEILLNKVLAEMKIHNIFQRVAMEALFGFGVCKVGVNASDSVDLGGYLHNPSMPFVEYIDFDDYVCDMTAKRWEEILFEGNRYYLPFEQVLASGVFNSKALANIKPVKEINIVNETGDSKAQSITISTTIDKSIKEYIILWDFWLPQEKKFITVADPLCWSGDWQPLRVVDWDEPEHGCYHKLIFYDVPGNLIPIAPVSSWLDIHTIVNQIYNKLAKQALRQKTLTAVGVTGDQDIQKINQAMDGESIPLRDPNATAELKFGGIDQLNMAFGQHLRELSSYIQGNLDMLGGLRPQADTLGQERMLYSTASIRLQQMINRMNDFAEDVITDIAYYLWTDPIAVYSIEKRIPGTSITVNTELRPEHRKSEIFNYSIKIVPYSMTELTPQQRLQALMQFVGSVYMPLAQIFMQNGVILDLQEFTRLYAKYTNMEEDFERLIGTTVQMDVPNSPVARPAGVAEEGRPASQEDINAQSQQMMQQIMAQAMAQGGGEQA